ncbi:toll/interleukin-1 receptor domain-containing protein [Rhizobium bangladeshense]|uniref:toll/interleukin-1 receptor domain-containing protein n=1 Tax=Rhizobium bangladeshense TaxID=1138189 RepID=UPI001C9111EB|nr:toll/interleukin-1 receptor domain-containing protein [Rhizobium bangladeshense]MBY3613523.1 toll/interleukin-1 receptor domain-containing protein [Rhizobium bangladeshense]
MNLALHLLAADLSHKVAPQREGLGLKKLWLTYCWRDNDDLDVDYIIQELGRAGLDVQFDRRQLMTGRRLWEQIDAGITKPENSDAWAIVVSRQSLQSEPCREEIAYALDRALQARGGSYPLMGIFVEHIDRDLIPSALRTRLYVTLDSNEWVERIRSGTHGEVPTIDAAVIPPQLITLHRDKGGHPLVVEARPRSGHWNPCAIRILAAEQSLIAGVVVRPSRKVPQLGHRSFREGSYPADRNWWMHDAGEDSTASPTMSMYAFFNDVPSRLFIGPADDMVEVDLRSIFRV